jgi:amino acid transporter
MVSVMSGTAPTGLSVGDTLPETTGYRLKRRLLGPALTNDQLAHERLTKKLALGVLSSDCISSSAYGTEEILLVLLPLFGLASYVLLLPMTLVVLAVLFVVTLSYRQVVTIYTKAGGSYVVARENFGSGVAQIAAVALMLDYIVTVAVQAAAGTVALTSAIPSLGSLQLEITVAVIVLLFYGNLRGIREAGKAFAFPTYFFVASMAVMLIAGFVREALGSLHVYAYPTDPAAGAFTLGQGHGILAFGAVYILLKSFANGGSSLTGLEAISNGVSAFERPEGPNARRTLVIMSVILGSLVAGISWMAHLTHAVPYKSGSPSVISQVAKAAFGTSPVAHVAFYVVQIATMLILYTGANTPFAGFPFLTSFVAEDSFLPRWLSKRGHRLAFSNGIVVLAVSALALVIGTGAHVDKLIAFYAIGVFTGFTLAGFGMAKFFRTQRTGNWRAYVAINVVSGSVAAVVVVIFAITKFTEGAWLVLVIFPVMVAALLRLRRQYAREAAALASAPQPTQPHFSRHVVLVLIDSVDLAVLRAVRYARSLRPYDVRAVHFVVDAEQARRVEAAWEAQPGLDLGLDLIECPDRRVSRAALELAARVTADGSTQVTLLLPRRTYSPLLGRLLHDRTADEIAEVVSRLPHAAATIVPFDVVHPIIEHSHGTVIDTIHTDTAAAVVPVQATPPTVGAHDVSCEPAPDGVTPLGDVTWRERATVQGKVRTVSVAPISGVPALRAELCDATGGIVLMFYGRRRILGIEPGATLRVEGMVGSDGNRLAIRNPLYELVRAPGDDR